MPTIAPSPTHDTDASPLRRFAVDDLAGMTKAFAEDGCALISSVITREEAEAIRAEMDRLRPFHFDTLAKAPGSGEEDWRVDHFKCVFNRSPFWLPYLDRPGVIELAEATLRSDCHVLGMSAIRRPPNALCDRSAPWLEPTVIHSDQVMFRIEEELLVSGRVQVPATICTAHYYLSDLTLELAPTWVVPGSHLSGRTAQDLPPEQRTSFRGRQAQPVLRAAGDVLYFRSELWHAPSRNRSPAGVRYLLQVHYAQRMMTQKFSPYLDFRFNHEVVASATPPQRRLLGDHRRGAYD